MWNRRTGRCVQTVTAMKRTLLNLATAVSLIVLVATVVFWVRSYTNSPSMADSDIINLNSTDPRYWILFRNGGMALCRQVGRDWSIELRKFDFLGIHFGGGRGKDRLLWNLVIPLWMVALGAAALPAYRGMLWRRERAERRRERSGCCPNCGYDLRASPERCPECGAIVVPQAV
jgi:hypothetical protein